MSVVFLPVIQQSALFKGAPAIAHNPASPSQRSDPAADFSSLFSMSLQAPAPYVASNTNQDLLMSSFKHHSEAYVQVSVASRVRGKRACPAASVRAQQQASPSAGCARSLAMQCTFSAPASAQASAPAPPLSPARMICPAPLRTPRPLTCFTTRHLRHLPHDPPFVASSSHAVNSCAVLPRGALTGHRRACAARRHRRHSQTRPVPWHVQTANLGPRA